MSTVHFYSPFIVMYFTLAKSSLTKPTESMSLRAKPVSKVGYVYLKNSRPTDPTKNQFIAF